MSTKSNNPPITETGVPHWLQPPDVRGELTEYSWNKILEGISHGHTLKSIVDDGLGVDYNQLLRWIHKNEARKAEYYQAREIGAEVIADDLIEISDGVDSMEDVARSSLRIQTRKWLLGVWNRGRYGDIKQIEQNVTIDISEAMERAQQRALKRGNVIEGEIVGGN